MPTHDGAAGFRLGKYELIKRLAAGGMAEIFLARASGLPGFQKMVVIKRILPVLATKGDFLEMFLNEARIAATLQHANVVQMYDVGVVDGNYFIAMEYLHGEDVRSIQSALHQRGERLPLEHALHIAIGVCAGLHYAHEKIGYDGQPLKIVHRDVSPQNVIVTYDGAVKLLDFGVAKATNNLHETACGVVKGKIPYMSPEQCVGRAVDRRSDLFSVGILLYELTLARRLYGGTGSEFEILKRIVEQPVPLPSELDPSYDPRLEQIVTRALAKDRDHRYETARELQVDLEDLARERRMYMSAIALQQFMERLFGHKIEAWRDADEVGRPAAVGAPTGEYDLEIIDESSATPMLAPVAPPIPASIAPPIPASIAPSISASPAPPTPASLSKPPRPLPTPRTLAWISLGAVLALAIPMVARRSSRAPHDEPRPPAAPTPAAPLGASSPEAGPPGIAAAPAEHAPAPRPVESPALRPPASGPIEHAPVSGPAERAPSSAALRRRLHHAASSRSRAPESEPARSAREAARASADAPAADPGTLVLASTPWCEVTVDGTVRGPTPLNLRLPPGPHRVRLANSEFHIDRTLDVTIAPGQTVRKRLDFVTGGDGDATPR